MAVAQHDPVKKPTNAAHMPQEEFDFRRVRSDQLTVAILYEYGRSCDWIVERFRRWQRQKLKLTANNGALRQWTELTVREVLEKESSGEKLPDEVQAAVLEGLPD